MPIKQAVLKQPASEEQPVLQDPAPATPTGTERGEAAASISADEGLAGAGVSSVISDEVLRRRVRALLEEKPEETGFKRLINHPLTIGLILAGVGFVLTVLVGGILTYASNVMQQELASQRSFNDELNKIRVQKIGEVWERVDKNEVVLDDLLENADNSRLSGVQKTQNVAAISELIRDDRVIINQNRFWLGDENYKRLQDYLDKNKRTALNILLAHPDTNLEAIIAERNSVKQDVLQIRENMRLEGSPRK